MSTEWVAVAAINTFLQYIRPQAKINNNNNGSFLFSYMTTLFDNRPKHQTLQHFTYLNFSYPCFTKVKN